MLFPALLAAIETLVLGGTTDAVGEAMKAAERSGDPRRVLLLAPRPYLGEDVAGTLELFGPEKIDRNDPVARAIWIGDEKPFVCPYTLTPSSSGRHVDTGDVLFDGRSDNVEKESVQISGPKGRIDFAFDGKRFVKSVELVVFGLGGKNTVREVHLAYNDRQGGTPVVNIPLVLNYSGVQRYVYRVELNREIDNLAVGFTTAEGQERVLLGEATIRVANDDDTRRVPTPLEVKSALDEVLNARNIAYRTGVMVTGVVKDNTGKVTGVTTASRQGERTFLAANIVDATRCGLVTLLAGGGTKGVSTEVVCSRVVVSTTKPAAEGLTVEELPLEVPVWFQGTESNKGVSLTAKTYRCSFASSVKELSMPVVAELEQRARDLTRTPGEVDSADEIVMRPFRLERHTEGVTRSSRMVDYDIVVIGGGTAGAPAAIAAARAGAKTLVVDYMPRLGGVGVSGMIGYYWYGNVCGFTKEVDDGITALGYPCWRMGKAEYWRSEIRKAGGDIWYESVGYDVVREGNAVKGVKVATPYGVHIVRAKVVIDATGSADLAAKAGAETEWISEKELTVQGAGMPTVHLGWRYANSDWGYVDDNNVTDAWLFGLRARRGGKGSWDVAQLLATRERRRMVGDYVVQPLDVYNERKFRDTIAQGRTDFDTHGPTIADACLVGEFNDRHIFNLNIPFRALLPKGVDNLAVVGIGASAHRDAMPFMRMQADVQNEGYAAGVAAAMAVKGAVAIRDIDVRALQRHLVDKGIVPAEVLGWEDSPSVTDEEISAAVKTVGDGYKGANIVLADPARALPLLREAYRAASEGKAKLCYAYTLGILGDATGVETLAAQALKPTGERLVINTEGKTSFGRRLNEFPSQLVALGRTKSPLAVPAIKSEIGRMKTSWDGQLARAIDLACEALPSPEFADDLAAVIRRPAISGHAKRGLEAATPRGGFGMEEDEGAVVRELHLARALWLCGDKDGLAKGILESYTRDPRGVFAKHARAVLKMKR